MGVVALRPLVLFVNIRAEASLVRVDHELLQRHCFLVLVQVHRELALGHEIAHCAALLCREWQRIYLLLFFVQGLYPLGQEDRLERVQLVGWRQLSVDYNEWPIEVRRAVHFQLVCKSVPWEPVAITLQEKYMQPYLFSLRMRYYAVGLYCYFLAENTKQWLFIYLHESAINGLPKALLGLKYVLETWILLLRSTIVITQIIRLMYLCRSIDRSLPCSNSTTMCR